MRRFAFCVLIVSSWCQATWAATVKPGGTLAANEVWTPAGSPYQVNGDLTIPDGRTLTIKPGVAVYLASGVGIVVDIGGRLLAEGTQEQGIRFTSPPGSSASWDDITIYGDADSPETRMAYVFLAGNSGGCIKAYDGTLYLDHATFGTTTHRYVSLDASSFLISNCHFPASTASFEMLYGTGGVKPGGRGIVRDCLFGPAKGYSDAVDFNGGNREDDQPILQLYNNVFLGSGDDGVDIDGGDAWIEGNIFMHIHRNGAPDTAAAISGGNKNERTSEVTVLGNLFFDCDNVATVKQGNFFTLINNTIVRVTKRGGMDTASGVVAVRDMIPTVSTFAKGVYLEGNIIVDVEQLLRNYDAKQTIVTLNNNILPAPWGGPGSGNKVLDPKLKYIPQVSETQFTTWEQAQVLRDWFSLQPGSPGRGTGPNGIDKGGVIPLGVSISGEPSGTTNKTDATLLVGVNRTDSGIPATGFPLGSGYTHYRWRLDNGAWSEETPLTSPIRLTGLAPGLHYVDAIGKNDAGSYQNDSALGPDATIALSREWIVRPSTPGLVINEVLAVNQSAVEREGTLPGMVELYYGGTSSLDLSGMSLVNGAANAMKFTFRAGTKIASKQYLILYADAAATSGTHLGFTLNPEGDILTLRNKAGTLTDRVEFGRQLADLSIGRVEYGGWRLTVPTFGTANIAHPLGSPETLEINEWLADGETLFPDGFIELYNPDGDPVDMAGIYLTDSRETPHVLNRVEPLSFVAGGGYAVFRADQSNAPGHVDFRLSSDGGILGLFHGPLRMIDTVTYGPQAADVSEGRVPDGGIEFEGFPLPTPGAENPAGDRTVVIYKRLVEERTDKRVLVPTATVSDDWKGGKAFNDSTWRLCAGAPGGVGYHRDARYSPLITLDMQAQMYGSGKNSTCYIRVPFTLDADALADINDLGLRIRHDDGFVAYLNGREVARRNFTGTPSRTSRAGTAHEAGVEDVDEYIDVTQSIGSLKAGANILAIHGMNASATSSGFLITAALDAILVKTVNESALDNELNLLDGLRITELMYQAQQGSNLDYIELRNVSDKVLDVTGVRLSNGIDFAFPAMTLRQGEYTVVVANRATFQSTYGTSARVAGEYSSDLSNTGEEVVLQLPSPFDAAILRFTYRGTWYPTASGKGKCLAIKNTASPAATWGDSRSWRLSDPTPGKP